MTPHQLLIPRVRCTAQSGAKEHYPGSPFEIGEVLTLDSTFDGYQGKDEYVFAYIVDRNPHLFRKLEWWEAREVEELKAARHFKVIKDVFDQEECPYYGISDGELYMNGTAVILTGFKLKNGADGACVQLKNITPATLEEFKHFKSK